MAEKSLIKKKGKLNCVLFRPAIIAAADQEPFKGWTDSLAAAGGLTLLASLGLMNYMYISTGGTNNFDVIPVDIVSNGIIVTSANAGTKKSGELDIYNCGTSA
jgi:fatty acyl-CoA reductase